MEISSNHVDGIPIVHDLRVTNQDRMVDFSSHLLMTHCSNMKTNNWVTVVSWLLV